MMRLTLRRLPTAVLLATLWPASGCTDLRSFDGTWSGQRVGDAPELKVGFPETATATLIIESANRRSVRAHLTIEGDVFEDALIQPIPGAEADVLAGTTFDGSPDRVYMAFAETSDAGGDAMVIVALYEDPRVEVRVLRGGPQPLYGVFVLQRP